MTQISNVTINIHDYCIKGCGFFHVIIWSSQGFIIIIKNGFVPLRVNYNNPNFFDDCASRMK